MNKKKIAALIATSVVISTGIFYFFFKGIVFKIIGMNVKGEGISLHEGWPIIVLMSIGVFVRLLESIEENRKIREAERKAYESNSQMITPNGPSSLCKSQVDDVSKAAIEQQQTISIGSLLSLYSQQIAKYQKDTRFRVSFSFFLAIFSMCAGMGFMFWGGSVIIADPSANHVAAGAAISAIGGGISAYITKTFLDVHKLSLTQLNRYFTQPVINDHIVMAQRLAEDVKDKEIRKNSYEKIVNSITALIDATNAELHKVKLRGSSQGTVAKFGAKFSL